MNDIEKIKSETFIFGFLDVLFLILPGILIIFLNKIELFLSLDWIKLVLLSASITTPFALLNTLIFVVKTAESSNKTNGDDLFGQLSLGIIITGVFLLVVTGVLHIFGKSLFSAFVFISITEIVFFAWVLVKAMRRKKI